MLESLSEVLKEDIQNQLQDLQKQLQDNENEQNKIRRELEEELQPKLTSLMEGVNRAKLIEVAISADIRVIKAQDALKSILRKRDAWRENIDEVKASTRGVKKTIKEIAKKREEAFAKTHRLSGQSKELLSREDTIEVKLKTREFKKVKEQYVVFFCS